MISRIKSKLKRDGLLGLAIAFTNYPFGIRRRKAYRAMLKMSSQKERFSEIYNKNLWSSSESGSGEGSEIRYTEKLRKWLIINIHLLRINTLVDAPCGDFNWMKLVLPNVNVDYLGLDIVDSVIAQNKSKYSSDKINFEVANICEDKLPNCDLVMVRDCLFHLSYDDINRFLDNLSNTDYKYLLTTTHIVNKKFKNKNIATGDFRLIDLFSFPFSFDGEKVKSRVDDFPEGYPVKREMILIEKRYVPNKLSDFSKLSNET